MLRYVKEVVLTLVLAVVGIYILDYAWLRYKVAFAHNPFNSIRVEPYYAVRLKDGKTEFMFDQPRNETCVNSLFPHLGHNPCWYVGRHTRKRIDM